ncbi:helix-turn-helix domain-containing protein [Pseudoduganella sp. DS3]|uniref:Helix-turn-helix domain-containing protein n=1 Tax=Pseudoduganella guangdongensis TaxID=2692179 RepID=A0A6N9HCA8_9BURK|nr:helix-turn-helix domain-containing protein [Pseudoduganella guangdongensis]MYN00633.1 helix-turn-helix domain-containing protein [Pseudoduganella guangdongensis]
MPMLQCQQFPPGCVDMLSKQLLFLFSALGAINGLLLACYLFSRRTQRLANCMLGALLVAIGVRTGKSTFYYFNPDLAVEFLQVGMSACLLIGPLTYLYVHCYLADLKQSAIGKHWRWHVMLAVFLVGLGIVFPYSSYPYIWHHVMGGIHIYWFTYLLLAGRELWLARVFSRQTILLHSVYFSSVLILAAYVSTPITSYIVGALSFTFSIHVTILTFFLQAEAKKDKYQNRKLDDMEAHALISSLDEVMRGQQLYLNPNLNLALLAKKVGNLQTTVSQVINDNLGKSFNQYINEFRIQHAKDLLQRESHLNMELVAERSGFNSNSTFFAAFKKVTGQTPASFRAGAAP